MRTIGLKPGDRVLVIERRHGRELVHNALTLRLSMDPQLVGTLGQMAIDAVMVDVLAPEQTQARFLQRVVHVSRRNGAEFAYEELPPQSGVCRYCGCTEHRACVDGNGESCSWLDHDRTVCSAFGCLEAAGEEMHKLHGLEDVNGED